MQAAREQAEEQKNFDETSHKIVFLPLENWIKATIEFTARILVCRWLKRTSYSLDYFFSDLHLKIGGISASETEEQVLLCYMNFHDGIEPYEFSLCLRNDVIEIVLLYRRQDGCTYCVTELVELLPLWQFREKFTRLHW